MASGSAYFRHFVPINRVFGFSDKWVIVSVWSHGGKHPANIGDDILRGMEMVAAASRKSVSEHRTHHAVRHNGVRWDKKMSNNCAAALLFYTMMQIFVVLRFIETKGMSIAPYFGLILLVAVIIPFCRNFEKRWREMGNSGLSDQSLAAKFRADQILLWLLAIGLPLVFVGVIKAIATIV